MIVHADHHLALRVADIELSTTFYTKALGGTVVMDFTLAADFAESIFGTAPGTTALNRFITFDRGAVEIYEFRPSEPIEPTVQAAVGLMHFCIWVDDVHEAVRRVEQYGGRKRFPIRPWTDGHHFVYAEDPDGNVIEILDASVEECTLYSKTRLPDHTAEA